MNSREPELSDRFGTTTDKIARLLPDVSQGDPKALDELVTLAHQRLLQLIRGKKAEFPGEPVGRGYRGDEQTGIIFSDLYLRLRQAVVNRKLSELKHPAGFWKIAASNVMYILLDMARARQREKDRRHGQGAGNVTDSTSAAGDEPRRAHEFLDGPVDPIEAIAESTRLGPESCLLRQEVLDSVQQLPEPHQTVISMYYYLGMTQREIALILQPTQPHLHERKVGRLLDQAEEQLRPGLGGDDA